MKCRFCRGEIEEGVQKCKHCGEWLDPGKRLRDAGAKNISEGGAQTCSTCGCLMIALVVFAGYAVLGGGN